MDTMGFDTIVSHHVNNQSIWDKFSDNTNYYSDLENKLSDLSKKLGNLVSSPIVSKTSIKVYNNTLLQVLMPPIPILAMVTVADMGLVLVVRGHMTQSGNRLAKSSNVVPNSPEMPRILRKYFLVRHFV